MHADVKEIITLKAKLTPPRLLDTIERARPGALLENILKARVTTITAGAGYGKSTFAAQACRAMGLKNVWYRLDESDGDLVVFMHYLIAGIQSQCNAFGDRTLARLRGIERERIDPIGICTLFLHEIEQSLHEPLIIVLDDFHLIQDGTEISSALQWIFQHLPEKLHFLIISRKALPPEFSRLIAARQVLGVTQSDLAFTPEEAGDLYQTIFGLTLSGSALEALAHKTGGWAAALILLHFGLADPRRGRVENQIVELNGESNLFKSYLETTIFQALPADVRSFLVKTSVLNALEVGFCNQLLGIENAGRILNRLENEHLFTFSLDREHTLYQYHHLFREFLRSKFKGTVDKAEARRLHSRAATLWEQRGDPHEAIEHCLAAEMYENARSLLVEHGWAIVSSGRLRQVLSLCRKIPDHLRKTPQLEYLMGNALFVSGRIPEALDVFEKARLRFEAGQDKGGACRCMASLAACASISNDFIRAEELYKALLAHGNLDPDAYALSLGGLIYICSRLRKIEQADHYFTLARPILDDEALSDAHIWIYIGYGNRCLHTHEPLDAIGSAEKAIDAAQRNHQYGSVAMAYHLIAFAWNMLFEYEKGLAAAVQGIRVSESYGFLESGYAWCLINASISATGLGRTAQALTYAEKSLSTYQTLKSDWTRAWSFFALCFAHMAAGNLDAAEDEGRRALNLVEKTPLALETATFQGQLAWVLLFKGKSDEATSFIRMAERMPHPPKSLTLWIALFHVLRHYAAGRIERAKADLYKILNEAPDRLLADHALWISPLLVALYADGRCKRRIEALFHCFKPADLALLKAQQDQIPGKSRDAARALFVMLQPRADKYLRINCFGTFRISSGGNDIPSKVWASAKAKMVLKYLAFHYKRAFVPKEELLELLWPEQDPAVTGKRLNVALSTIRKILEPDLPKGARSAFILRENESYRLDLGENGFLDVADFDRALEAAAAEGDAHKAHEYHLEAEALFKGELFGEEPYVEWCEAARTRYREKYLHLLQKIADHHEVMGNTAAAIDHLQRLIQIDPYAEEIYCRLMVLHHQGGNRSMALKTYEQCRQKIEVDLRCPLSAETLASYRFVSLSESSKHAS